MSRSLTHMLAFGGVTLLLMAPGSCERPLVWETIVNNGDAIPGSAQTFNSYGQPSLNARGLVVFRGRGIGPNPERGVFSRDMASGDPVQAIAITGDAVPDPNNTLYNGEPASFNEFPAFPRIDVASDSVATRGQSRPVWTFLLADGSESRVGTAGVFAQLDGALQTGASLLGAVRDAATGDLVFPEFQVPGATEGTRFDQFPGSPAVTNGSVVVFKGNFTDGVPSTGVFYRDLAAEQGASPVQLLARAGEPIPNRVGAVFGSTAPPSAANGSAFFVGLDSEELPTAGGIYRAALAPSPPLEPLVEIGSAVPTEPIGPNTRFNAIGEAISVSENGRLVAFWGAWGTERRTLVLECPTDGNADLLAYCVDQYPDGFETTVPVHQGIFVYDTVTGRTTAVARTGLEDFVDFLYWTFSGRVPGVGGGDEGGESEEGEAPRWRSSAFVALSSLLHAPTFRVAFKGQRGDVDGIYVRTGAPGGVVLALAKVVEVGDPGQSIDPDAPDGSLVIGAGIEREGFRAGHLALTASMLFVGATEEETVGWAGVYRTRVYGED